MASESTQAATDDTDDVAATGRRETILDALGLLVRLGLAAIWLISGWIKASDPIQTRLSVRAYELMPDSVADIVAMILPYAELAVGLLLLVGLATRLSAVLSALMLVAFIFGVAQAAARGLSIDCGCFGGGGEIDPEDTAYTEEILRDIGFLILAAYLMWRPRSWVSLDRVFLRQ